MAKVKVGTVLDETLYQRVQEAAQAQGQTISHVLEEALRLYLERRADGVSLVRETFGKYRLSREDWEIIMEDDPYDT